ncbi:hypothetical protein L1987_17567 [Smallanthus sonchifolius]|uniref:Uncharacterized protein n=1 Tax=Smallanthus sonchifolius TaxID=185202 RepID=A0ACB9IY62_9ASTR|nr:hypothetical protein L1987_17567 [Smallanthus sonchifolius]
MKSLFQLTLLLVFDWGGPRVLLGRLDASSSSDSTAYAGRQSHRQLSHRTSLLCSAKRARLLQPEVCSDVVAESSSSMLEISDCTSVCEHCGAILGFAERLMFYPLSVRLNTRNQLSMDVVSTLASMLYEVNEYVRLLKGAKEIYSQPNVPEFAGDGIQAIAHGRKDQQFVESSNEIGNCYCIEAYACVEPNRHVNAFVNMRIGASSSIIPITNTDEFPRQYFNFCSRATLCDNENVATDYFGILRGIEDKTKKDGNPNQDIQVTLWEEVATSNERFDREAIKNSPHPTILAVTAMKVTSFLVTKVLTALALQQNKSNQALHLQLTEKPRITFPP